MLSKFVSLLREQVAEDKDSVAKRLLRTERLGNDAREGLVSAYNTLERVERMIDELYKADEDQLEEMDGEKSGVTETQVESGNKIRRAVPRRRQAGSWGGA